eukprot:TRINITY_DN5632_c0_g1_i1.p1 TRINITY_DN5632_c0_g1~~TRINITY_DN5632_c0_g1_i1.p1  ORF type:complete len:308 (+),score=47.40 TRINITY_DN5632_c0_g1_i1:243-1166(+)
MRGMATRTTVVIGVYYEGHMDDVWELMELDDNRFATLSFDYNIEDSTLTVWDKTTCKCLETLHSRVLNFMKLRDGSTIICALGRGSFEFRRTSDLAVVKTGQLPHTDSRMLCKLEDDTFIFYDEAKLQRWDVLNATLLQIFSVADLTEISEVFELNKDTIVGGTHRDTIIWRLSTGERLKQISYKRLIGSVKLSEGYFATIVPWADVGDDYTIELWNEHGERYATYDIDYCISMMIRLADGSIVTYEFEEYGIQRPPALRIHKQLPFSSLVDRCCLAIVTHFGEAWILIQGLPDELYQLLAKFYDAT